MISRNQDMYNINFLDATTEKLIEAAFDKKTEKKAEEFKPQSSSKTNKLDNNKAIDSRFSNTILSAGQGTITNNGGSGNQMGSKTSNSIWDTDVIDRLKQTKDNSDFTQGYKLCLELILKELNK